MNYASLIKVKIILILLLTFSNFYAMASNITGTSSNIEAKHIGPAVGGAMFAIAIDPTNKNNIFFSGDMGVVYHTIDGGNSWSIVPGMYRIRSIKFDPNNTNIIWAIGSTGVYKSIDGGATWQYSFSTYHRYNFTLGAIAIDPTDSNIVYVAEGFVSYFRLTYVRGRVFKTTNGGKSWKLLTRPGGDTSSDSIYNRNYSTILIDPNSSYTSGVGHSDVYLMGRDGLFKSTDAGGSWQNITFFDEGQGSDAILIDDNNQTTLVVSVIPMKNHSKKGVYKSTDNGQTWQEINNGLEDIIHALSIRNKNIKRTTQFSLMLAHSRSDKNTIYVGSWQGVAKTTNQGQSWTQTTPAETPYIKHVSGKYVQAPLNTHPNQTKTFLGGIDNFIKMTASDSDSNFVIFGDNRDIHFSTDGGTVWESRSFDYKEPFVNPPTDVLPTLPENSPANVYTHTIKSRGVQGLVNNDIVVDPFDPKTYYATYRDVGLYVSRDAGETWEHPTIGLPPRGHAWSVTVDPNNDGVVWVSMAKSGSVYKSIDHGVSWSDVSINTSSTDDTLPTSHVRDLAFDAQNSILYAATNKGIYKSSNGGQNWQSISNRDTFDIKIDLSNKDILYAGTKTGLYKSTDRGNNWNQLASDKMGKVYNISVSKNNTIYVISNKSGEYSRWQSRKLWVSTDGGVNFSEITPSFMHPIGGVAVDPNDPQHIYISTYGTNQKHPDDIAIMAQSKDGGLTWEKLVDNFAFALGTDIYINPKNPSQIFFNTNFSLIEVNNNNTPVVTLTANAGDDVVLNVTPSHRAVYLNGKDSTSSNGHTIVSYKWYDGDRYIGSGATRWYTPNSAGVHDVKLVITDDQGNSSEDHKLITVYKQLKANAGKDINVAITSSNTSVRLDGTASSDPTNIASYEWFDANGTRLGVGSIIDITPPAIDGAYPVTLTVKDEAGHSDSDTVVINVTVVDSNISIKADAGEDKVLNVTPSHRAVYLNGSKSFATQGIVSYKWYDGTTYIGSHKRRWYVPNGSGVHDIKLVITDTHGNTDEDHMSLTVNN